MPLIRREAGYWMSDALSAMEHWCIGGDFNIIEDCADRGGGSHAAKLATWERLCMTLRLSNVWHHEGYGDTYWGTNLSWMERFYVGD